MQAPQTGLTLRDQERPRTERWRSGLPICQVETGHPVTGPGVKFSLMDRDLQPPDMASFADTLIRASDLPQ